MELYQGGVIRDEQVLSEFVPLAEGVKKLKVVSEPELGENKTFKTISIELKVLKGEAGEEGKKFRFRLNYNFVDSVDVAKTTTGQRGVLAGNTSIIAGTQSGGGLARAMGVNPSNFTEECLGKEFYAEVRRTKPNENGKIYNEIRNGKKIWSVAEVEVASGPSQGTVAENTPPVLAGDTRPNPFA